ncbi:MAG: hypothetical protein E7441_01105 [Ruminococcaceae bacterium]|nr:hypothetical protein [Oscillospiraceae bacterium]
MRKKTLRLLAFIIAAVMVVCMAPIASAEGATTSEMSEVKVVYELNTSGVPSGKTTLLNTSNETINYSDTNGFWRYASNKYMAYSQLTADYCSMYCQGEGYIAFEIYVPTEGKYNMELEYAVASSGLESGSIHIIPAQVSDIESAINSDAYSVIPDFTSWESGAPTTIGSVAKGECNIETAGEHYLVFAYKGYNRDKRVIRAQSLTLDGGTNTVPMISSLTATTEDDVTTVTAAATLMSDGTAASGVTYSYSVAEDDAAFATVDAATGVVTGKGNGTATIIAKATTDNVHFSSKSIEVPVKNPNMSGVKAVYNFKLGAITTGKKELISNGDAGAIDYNDTNGFWRFAEKKNGNDITKTLTDNYLSISSAGANKGYIALMINVPVKGEYNINYEYWQKSDELSFGTLYIIPATQNIADVIATTEDNEYLLSDSIDYYKDTTTVTKEEKDLGTKFFDAGEYYVVFSQKIADDKPYRVGALTLDGGKGTVPMVNITSAPESIEAGKTASITAESTLMSDAVTPVTDATITYSVDSEGAEIAEVSAGGVITAKRAGTATVIATATKDNVSSSKSVEVTVTAPKAGEEVTDTKVNIYVTSADPNAGSAKLLGDYETVAEVERGTTIEVEAIANNGYEFAYWKNKAGVVLSTEPKAKFNISTNTAIYAEFTAQPVEGNVPVYFYNGNGLLHGSASVAEGATFAEAKEDIENPKLTGYDFLHWSIYADKSAIADNTPIKALTRAVAIYGDKANVSFTVKKNGVDYATGKKYGDEITVTSDDPNFKCWKVGDEVVSYSPSYKFCVYADVDLVEETDGAAAPVAVLTKADGNDMLIYSVPEKYTILEAGLLFGTRAGINIDSVDGSKAIAVKGTGQFTALPADESHSVTRGYLIFKTPDGETRVLYAD